jgi:small subunit ribosomal protein S17
MNKRGISKFKEGVVIASKMKKTVVVEVERRVKHPVFKKYYTRTSTFYVHDEGSTAKIGDYVRIKAVKPVSKLKRWKVIEVIRKGFVDEALQQPKA